jgi:hypothetical protein
VFSVVHRLINWKVLKTLLFPVFNEFRAIPQAEVRIIKDFKSFVFGSADYKGVMRFRGPAEAGRGGVAFCALKESCLTTTKPL